MKKDTRQFVAPFTYKGVTYSIGYRVTDSGRIARTISPPDGSVYSRKIVAALRAYGRLVAKDLGA